MRAVQLLQSINLQQIKPCAADMANKYKSMWLSGTMPEAVRAKSMLLEARKQQQLNQEKGGTSHTDTNRYSQLTS